MNTSTSKTMLNCSRAGRPLQFVYFLCLVGELCLVHASPTIRYLHCRLQGDSSVLLEAHSSTTLAKAWKHCQRSNNCVSFGFQAAARYPGANVSVAYYSVADWHIPSHLIESESFFVPDDTWHLYVNTTREEATVATEVQQVLSKMKVLDARKGDEGSPEKKVSSGRLRSRSTNRDTSIFAYSEKSRLLKAQEKAGWLMGLFGIAKYKQLRSTLIPFVTRELIQIASDDDEMDEIRTLAMETILALTDSYETSVILQGEYKLLDYLQAMIQPPNGNQYKALSWGVVNSMALDLISNMALHRAQSNPFVVPTGLLDLLQRIAQTESGSSIGLQATLALIHFLGTGGGRNAARIDRIPISALMSLLELLEATIDGDAVYGYDWDLMPGPLSAIQLLVTGAVSLSEEDAASTELVDGDESKSILDTLLNAGLVEQLVRILDQSETLPSASTTLATLETLQLLQALSPKAEAMVAMVAASSIEGTKRRLEDYESAKKVAQSLSSEVAAHKLHQNGGWMEDDQEL